MIDKTHQLSVRQQSQLIQINRSTLYYKPKEISSTDLSWMRLIDEIHLDVMKINVPPASNQMVKLNSLLIFMKYQ